MYLHIFDRSNLDEVVAIKPGNPSQNVTRRMDLERGVARGGWYGRRDVVLMNGTNSGREYVLEVAEDPEVNGCGFVGDLFLLDVISEIELGLLRGYADRMRQNARDFAPAKYLLNRS
jgi:hypothetical protein